MIELTVNREETNKLIERFGEDNLNATKAVYAVKKWLELDNLNIPVVDIPITIQTRHKRYLPYVTPTLNQFGVGINTYVTGNTVEVQGWIPYHNYLQVVIHDETNDQYFVKVENMFPASLLPLYVIRILALATKDYSKLENLYTEAAKLSKNPNPKIEVPKGFDIKKLNRK